MSRAVLDTSILVGCDSDRPLMATLPDEVAISVVTLAELELGVLVAPDEGARARRLRTLTEIRAAMSALPIDGRTASEYAQLVSAALAAGTTPRGHDAWVAATAVANGAQVWTQDPAFSDFGATVDVVRIQ